MRLNYIKKSISGELVRNWLRVRLSLPLTLIPDLGNASVGTVIHFVN